jgi:hypothetical protein
MRSGADLNRSGAACGSAPPYPITEPLRPATANPPGFEPGLARLELAVLSSYTTSSYKRTTRLERASPGWRPGALPTELHPRESTPGWNRTSVLCRRRAALCPLSYELRSPRQELNPHLGRTKGACLPLTLRRQEGNRPSWSAFGPSSRRRARTAYEARPSSACVPRSALPSRSDRTYRNAHQGSPCGRGSSRRCDHSGTEAQCGFPRAAQPYAPFDIAS